MACTPHTGGLFGISHGSCKKQTFLFVSCLGSLHHGCPSASWGQLLQTFPSPAGPPSTPCAAALPPAAALPAPTPLPGAKSRLFKDPALGSPHPILWQNKPWISLMFFLGTQKFLEELASNVLFLNNHPEIRVGEPRLAGLMIHLLDGHPKTRDADTQALL